MKKYFIVMYFFHCNFAASISETTPELTLQNLVVGTLILTTMNNQINHTTEGAQARVNNLSYAMQMAELESQMEQEAIKEQVLLADLECQAEQDAILYQMMLVELAYEAEQDAVAEAMYLEELAYEAEQDAVAEAMYLEELAYEEELACF